MILLPNPKKPRSFGDAATMRSLPRFHVVYENSFWLSSIPTPMSGVIGSLTGGLYVDKCVWGALALHITGWYDKGADCLVLGAPSANYMTGTFGGVDVNHAHLLANGWGERIKYSTQASDFLRVSDNSANGFPISRKLAPGETELGVSDQKIIAVLFKGVPETGNFDLTLHGSSQAQLNKFFIGKLRSWLPPSNYSYELQINGKGKMTDAGAAYGYRAPSRRLLSCSWDGLRDADRREVERYMDFVQNVSPHYIFPSPEMEYIPPLFGVLTDPKMPNVKQKNSWTWGGMTLNYTEVA
ncbi:MAG: hypothetical protein LBL45_10255 [Treponema sp.]|jgi:hypothetical protein|nr:hypothetical protein [Treponema sp.]